MLVTNPTIESPSLGGKFNYNPRTSKSVKRGAAICSDCRETPNLNTVSQMDMFMPGHAKSNLRVHLAGLKDRQAMLEKQLQEKEDELQKLKMKTSESAKAKAREELQRALNVLKHIKKRAGPGIYDVEY